IVDVTTSTLGALGGAVSMAVLVTAVVRARDGHFLLGVPTFLLAGAYGMATLCEAVTPLFRSDRLPGVEGGPLTLLDTMLDRSVPLRLGEVPLFDGLLYAPAGFLVVAWLIERTGGARRARRLRGAARRVGVAPVPPQDRRRRHRPAAHRGAPHAARVSVRASGRVQRFARGAAVSAPSAARERARRLAAAPSAAPVAGGVAGRRHRGGTHRDRRALLRCDQRAGGVRGTGNRVARGAALRIRAARGCIGAPLKKDQLPTT